MEIPMEWFRFYDEVLDDPKVQRLPAALFRDWINILCLCNRNDPRGVLPSIDDVAFGLRYTVTKAKSTIKKLHEADLLVTESGVTYPNGWSKRQRVSDDVAKRVSEHRAKKQAGNVTGNDTCNVTSNAPETLPHVRATETDTETETDTDLSPSGERVREAKIEERPEQALPPSRIDQAAFEKRFGKPDPLVLVAAMCDAQGVMVDDLSKREQGQQKAIAQRLITEGMTDDDVRRITTWLISQSWVTSGVDMNLIGKQRSKWILAGKPDRYEKSGSKQPANMQSSGDEHRYDDEFYSGGFGKAVS